MFKQLKYFVGSAGSSGFGSKSTAEEVTEACPDLTSITAIITGMYMEKKKHFISLQYTTHFHKAKQYKTASPVLYQLTNKTMHHP